MVSIFFFEIWKIFPTVSWLCFFSTYEIEKKNVIEKKRGWMVSAEESETLKNFF